MRNIFSYWDKGMGKMPEPIKKIYDSNIKFLKKKGLRLRLLSDDNAEGYVGILPAFYYKLSPNHKSDYLRWEILYKYGGMWADTDIIFFKDVNLIFDELYSLDSTDVMFNIEYKSEISNILQENCVDELVFFKDYYIKPACCVVFAKPKSDFINYCRENTINKIESSIDLNWWDIGPSMISKAYRNNKSKAKIINDSEMDLYGFNAVTWKVNIKLPTIISNYPGYNKSQWYGNSKNIEKKAKRMLSNRAFFYLPIWSIYKRHNLKDRDISSVLFNDEQSLYFQLLKFRK